MVSSHPVHLLGPGDSILPSAFIPLCSLGGNVSAVSREVAGLGLVCSAFRPAVLGGRLCYSMQPDLQPGDFPARQVGLQVTA